jgi:hypothetical protein
MKTNETWRKPLRQFTPTTEQIRWTVVCGDLKVCAFHYAIGSLEDCHNCCFTYSPNKQQNFSVGSVPLKTLPVTKTYTPSVVDECNASVPNVDRMVLTAENRRTTRKTALTHIQSVNHKSHLGWPEIYFRPERWEIYQSYGSSYKK